MPRFFAAAALIFCGFAVHAALPAAPLPGERDALPLGSYAETLEDPHGQLTLAEVASRSDFVPVGRNVANFGYSYSAHWLRFTLPRDTGPLLAPLLALEIRFPSLDSIELYVPYRTAQGIEYRVHAWRRSAALGNARGEAPQFCLPRIDGRARRRALLPAGPE